MQSSSLSLAAPSDTLVTSLRASASELAMLDTALACVAAFCAIMSLAAILNAVKNTREIIHAPRAVFSRLKAPIIACAVSSCLSIALYCICRANDIEDTMLTVGLVASIISLLVIVIAMAILGFSIERGEQQYDADNVDNNADNADTSDASNPVPATTFDDTTTLTDNMSENTNTYPVSHTTSDTASFNTDVHDTTNGYTNNDTTNMPTIS